MINFYVGRPTVAGDRLIAYNRGRCTVQGAGANEPASFQMKDTRMGAYKNLETNVFNSAYCKSYASGTGETIDAYDDSDPTVGGEFYYSRGINKKGAHYSELWQWTLNTPDMSDGGHLIVSKRDDVAGGQITKSSLLYPNNIQSGKPEMPCWIKWQQTVQNRGANGTQTLQTDVEWLNTDFFAQLNGSVFVIANNAVFTSATEFTHVVPLQFDSTGRWWVRQWKGKLADYSNAYIHLLDENLNSVVSQKLGV